MDHLPGEPVRGIMHSADASSGVEIPLYSRGSTTARVLASNEYLEIDSVELVTVTGGDSSVILSANSTLDTGETVLRGSFAANGGSVESHARRAGTAGAKPYVISPSGVVDVVLAGRIMKSGSTGARESWREKVQA